MSKEGGVLKLISPYIFDGEVDSSIINYIPTYIDNLIRIIVMVLLIIDFRKYELKNVVISCIAALLFPLLGVVTFAILFIGKEINEANALNSI